MANVNNFECSYCGVPFRIPDPALLARIEHFGWLESPRDVLTKQSVWPGSSLQRAGLPESLPYPPAKLNEYFYPTGASRFSIFRGLMTAADVASVKAVVWPVGAAYANTGTFLMSGSCDTVTYPITTGLTRNVTNSGYVQTSLYMLPPLPVCADPGQPSDTVALYMVVLVDERYFWHQYYSAGVIEPGTGGMTTWTNIVDQISSNLGVKVTATGLSAGLATVAVDDLFPEADSPLYSQYESPAALLDVALANLHQVLVREFDGRYTTAQIGFGSGIGYILENTEYALNGSLKPGMSGRVLGGRSFVGVTVDANGVATTPAAAVAGDYARIVLPQQIQVTFPKWITGTGYYEPTTSRSQFSDDSYGAVWTETVNTTTVLGAGYKYISGSKKFLKTTAKAEFTLVGDVAPANAASTSALALWLAKNWLYSRFIWMDESFRGIVGGCGVAHPEDRLFHWSESDSWTRLMANPLNAGWSEYQHSFETPSLSQPVTAGLEVLGRTGDITGVTKLTIDRGALSGTAANAVFSHDDASATLPGDVNLVDQTLGGGTKSVVGLIVAPNAFVPQYGLQIQHGVGCAYVTDQLGNPATVRIGKGGGISFGCGLGSSFGVDDTAFSLGSATPYIPGINGQFGSMSILCTISSMSFNTNVAFFQSDGTVWAFNGFGVGYPSTVSVPGLVGKTGTDTIGNVFAGGIITTIGTGPTTIDGGTF